MTAITALRNATLLAAVVTIGIPSAFAVNPGLAPRNTEPIVPSPQDPYNTYSTNPTGQFDPFAPAGGFGATLPTTKTPGQQLNIPESMRIAPSVVSTPQPTAPSRWTLGIFSTNTGTGVQIVTVNPNTPAEAAGLEINDTIVNVSGYQVGYVHNHLHELSLAFNEYADTDGYVMLLVHDNRSGNLINLPVQLRSRGERIQGTIGFQAQTRLPANAQAQIALQEIVREGVIVPIAQKTVYDLRQNPMSFVLDVDPSVIQPNRQYVVHADITAGNTTLLTTRNAYRVLTAGYPKTVDMRLYPTATASNVNYNGYADNRQEQLDQIGQWYQDYLHRDLRPIERDTYQSSIDRGIPMNDIQAQLLAHPEFWTQAQEDDRRYIENMYIAVLGRRPQAAEVDAWIARLEARQHLRKEIAREFLAQVSKQQ